MEIFPISWMVIRWLSVYARTTPSTNCKDVIPESYILGNQTNQKNAGLLNCFYLSDYA